MTKKKAYFDVLSALMLTILFSVIYNTYRYVLLDKGWEIAGPVLCMLGVVFIIPSLIFMHIKDNCIPITVSIVYSAIIVAVKIMVPNERAVNLNAVVVLFVGLMAIVALLLKFNEDKKYTDSDKKSIALTALAIIPSYYMIINMSVMDSRWIGTVIMVLGTVSIGFMMLLLLLQLSFGLDFIKYITVGFCGILLWAVSICGVANISTEYITAFLPNIFTVIFIPVLIATYYLLILLPRKGKEDKTAQDNIEYSKIE